MDRRSLLAVLGVIAGASVGLNAASGCNSVGNLTAPDAAPDQSSGDSGPPADCTGDPPVMYILDDAGHQAPPDWSCYQPDAAALIPLDFDAGDDGASDAGDDGDDGASDDSSTPGDAGADAGPPSDAGGDADAGLSPFCRFHMVDFETPTLALPLVGVEFFFSNDTTMTPDFTATTADFGAGDGGPMTPGVGDILMPIPTGPVWAYRSIARGADAGAAYEPLESLNWYDFAACTAGSTVLGEVISVPDYEGLVAGVLNGGTPDPTKEVLTAAVRDCQNRYVAGGILQIYDDTTMQPVAPGEGSGDLHAEYFNDESLPSPICTHTTLPQALFSALNVPTDRPLHLRAYGRFQPSDSATSPPMIGERAIPALPGQIVIIRPYRLTPN